MKGRAGVGKDAMRMEGARGRGITDSDGVTNNRSLMKADIDFWASRRKRSGVHRSDGVEVKLGEDETCRYSS